MVFEQRHKTEQFFILSPYLDPNLFILIAGILILNINNMKGIWRIGVFHRLEV